MGTTASDRPEPVASRRCVARVPVLMSERTCTMTSPHGKTGAPALGSLVGVGLVVMLAGCGGGGNAEASKSSPSTAVSAADVASRFGTEYQKTGTGPMVDATVPQTPSGKTEMGDKRGNVRTFRLTAGEFSQKIANFPVKTMRVWGYNGSTPGPTLVAYEGEQVRVIVKNELGSSRPDEGLPVKKNATTVHFHGMHQPNEDDGVAGISQPEPIPVGGSFTYEFKPGHVGTFAYHSHTDSAVQELRGLDGFFIILPRKERKSVHVDRDYAMTLQQFDPKGPSGLVDVFPEGTGDFPFSTVNGKTGDAAGGPLTIKKGDRVRIRVYNASNLSHSMHLHGMDSILTAKNGHAVPPVRETTQNVAPGDFFDLEFTADNPGNWIFHCHVPHHTGNAKMSGYNGAPVGMTRIFHYDGYRAVPKQYFAFNGKP